ncbi:MAG: bifunctional proline dehydrogenase/L-glutamate gamma-semialdehyde dehydrogenase PutA [Rubrivivax sp.]|nr:MAG: bifunctional proline dehydrogenase/L-glutamate gamma-semialdehyde dehydrogenase PutA [Rubrivivax sp.]
MNKLSDRLPLPWADEAEQVDKLRLRLQDQLDWGQVRQQCEPWVRGIRHRPPPFWALESLLQEFPLSSAEGLALMRLAEALLRVPDQDTAQALIGDQLTQADFAKHAGQGSAHPWLSQASARVLNLAHQLLPSSDAKGAAPSLVQRLGGPTVVSATARALQLLGRQFVLGQTIDEALDHARQHTHADAERGLSTRHSFDMLGEGARTWADADRYLAAYQQALRRLGQASGQDARQRPFSARQGLSIKLSALHPRFDPSQHDALVRELLPRLEQLARQADEAGVLLTLDAEESFRLELQLDLLARLMPAAGDGLGLAVQAYQHRALAVIDEVHRLATTHDKRLTVRLVKGAYWDTEVKRAQELGLNGYPVYTHKAHTDLSYLACADALLARSAVLYPQFATHNAATIAAVMQLARQHGVAPERYEWQRLHGMGEGVYRELRRPKTAPDTGAALRIYAPVGEHRDLLAYLVRRLLENGANASFVHQLADPQVSLDELLASPWQTAASADCGPLMLPVRLYGPERRNALGRDLNCQMHRDGLEAAVQLRRQQSKVPSPCHDLCAAEAQALMEALWQGWQAWEETPATERCAVLDRVANQLEAEFDSWAADLVIEARKTMSDAVAEVRETIDLARYYAQQGRHHLQVAVLPGPTGESNEWQLRGRGVFVCIAPWNFPLAIFGGQVMAALVAGNAVAAKPADQTPTIGRRFVALLHQAGVPSGALGCACGPGQVVGAALVASQHCAGVAFTGSVATGKRIQRMLAQGDRPIVPLIAETGGLNAMVVDSTALPEQVMDAVVASAFLSAGQRCSALRLLCLHSATADALESMLAGALQTLVTGDSADWSTDVGPVIDAHAHELLNAHLSELEHQSQQPRSGVRLIGQTRLAPSASSAPHIVPPTAYTLPRVGALTAEHFGPILHVVRWGPGTSAPDIDALIDQINATGYGLTLGVQTRIDSRAQHIARRTRVGNVYVNRGMTGAVVGSQPFGGQGWSGTGPKAGGPHYLLRFCTEQVVSINTAAAGGNAALLTRSS